MPLTEIDVTTPNPIFDNYWRQRDAAKAAMPPPPPWPAVDPGLLEEGRPRLPAFPLQVFPRQWREWVSDAAQWAGSSEDYVAQALLAAVLALLDWAVNRPNNAPPPRSITERHLLDAWNLWERYYRPHAQAVFDRAGGDHWGSPRCASTRAA